MNKRGDIFFIVGRSVCLGSVKSVFDYALGRAVICRAVKKYGNIKGGKNVAVCNKGGCYVVRGAVAVKNRNVKLNLSAKVLI